MVQYSIKLIFFYLIYFIIFCQYFKLQYINNLSQIINFYFKLTNVLIS